MSKKKVLVAGAGGFIGHHLVKVLKARGYWVRGVDIKNPEFEASHADDFRLLDLRHFEACREACDGMNQVYQLAADMGGIGYITAHHATIFRHNALINLHMLEAARESKVVDYLYTSSACVYPQYLQKNPDVTPLKEADAYPADAEPGYGWEKLMSELAAIYYRQDFGLKTHVVRFHNIFGPLGTFEGGKEKAPAAISRKVALASDGGEIEIWGDGLQTRSFCYIDDCVEGLQRIMASDFSQPINLGQDRMVSVDELVDIISAAAGKKLVKRHDLSKPQGVRGRNSDNTLLRKTLGWEPQISLEDGLGRTYRWIQKQLEARSSEAATNLRAVPQGAGC